jgi:hypothetical protein
MLKAHISHSTHTRHFFCYSPSLFFLTCFVMSLCHICGRIFHLQRNHEPVTCSPQHSNRLQSKPLSIVATCISITFADTHLPFQRQTIVMRSKMAVPVMVFGLHDYTSSRTDPYPATQQILCMLSSWQYVTKPGLPASRPHDCTAPQQPTSTTFHATRFTVL